jgi:hypothetical protein
MRSFGGKRANKLQRKEEGRNQGREDDRDYREFDSAESVRIVLFFRRWCGLAIDERPSFVRLPFPF